jgi:hypothetical protein
MSIQGPTIPNPLASADDDQPLPRTDVFEVLSNERRRCVLHYLKQQDDRRVELRELVDHVAAWETDTTLENLDSEARKRVYTALRQNHLPKLDDAGIIDYEHMRGEVELTEHAREVELYLEYVPGNDIPWSEYYLGLSAVSAALIIVTWLGVYPFTGLSGLGLAALLVTLYTISAVVHTYEASQNRIGADEYELDEP